MNKFLYAFIFSILILSSLSSAVLLSDQGTDVKQIPNGTLLPVGNLTILVYSAPSSGNPIYNQTFPDAIINGSWNVMITPSLEFGNSYWKDYIINNENMNFSNDDRLEFQSPLGLINNISYINFSLISSCADGSSIKRIYANGSVTCETDDSGISSIDLTNYSLKNQSETFSGNITTTHSGLFGFLGSLAQRITKIFATDIDVSNNIVVAGNVSATYFLGDGSKLTNLPSSINYTHLSNFTNDRDYINSTQVSTFNQTYENFWSSNNTIWSAINSALAGGNASWNQTFTQTLFSTFGYVNSQVSGNKTEMYNMANANYSNLTSYIGVYGYDKPTVNSIVSGNLSVVSYTNGSGINLVGNQFNVSRAYLDTIYYLVSNPSSFITNAVSDLVNYFTKTEVDLMISQNLTASKIYANTNINANLSQAYSSANANYSNLTSYINAQSTDYTYVNTNILANSSADKTYFNNNLALNKTDLYNNLTTYVGIYTYDKTTINNNILGNLSGTYNSTYDTWLPNYTLSGKFWYNHTEMAFGYINANYTSSLSYTNTNILANLSQAYSSANANYSNLTSYIDSLGLDATFNKAWVQNNFINSSNATINNGVKFWYNQTEPALYIGNLNLNLSKNYTNEVLQGNLTSYIGVGNVTINGLFNNGSYLSTYNASYVYTNGTGINLDSNVFSASITYLDTIYARIANFFSKTEINDMISQNRTAVLSDSQTYTNTNINANLTESKTYANVNVNGNKTEIYNAANANYSNLTSYINAQSTDYTYVNTNINANLTAGKDYTNNQISGNLTTAKIYTNDNTLGNVTAISSNVSNLFIPYMGAWKDINLGNNNVTINGTTFYIGTINERVGIGTITPSMKLDVRGAGNFSGLVYVNNGTEILAYINSNVNANLTTARDYTNTNMNGNLTESKTYSNTNINGNKTEMYNMANANYSNLTSYIGSYGYDKTTVNNIVSNNISGISYTNGTGINLDSNVFSASITYLDTIYARIANFFSKTEINDMISQNRTAVLSDSQTYTNTNINANNTAVYSNLTSSFIPYIGAIKNVVLGSLNVTINNSAFFFNSASGRLGIGTLTPSQELDVRGYGNFSGTVFINNGTDLSTMASTTYVNSNINISDAILYNNLTSYITTNNTASYVPYTGATKNTNLGTFNLSMGSATIYWNGTCLITISTTTRDELC